MVRNVGNVDRIARLILGIAVIAAGFAVQSWLGALGLIFIGTALVGFCPIYTLFGINTCPVKPNRA
ncbi:MAG: DUF2892 domain-containing protein [Chloroflexi bacterium]|nr:DUF2892 domain-containing protein [Chloroflexota bacterium]